MNWLNYLIIGGYAYTTIVAGWFQVMLSWVRGDIAELRKEITNETHHEIESLKERVSRLEGKTDA